MHAGVSEATVSRVLNGKPGVSAAKRQAVLGALDVLGYQRPARPAQRPQGLVGLITPELDNPIFPAFAQAIERSLAQHGHTTILCTQVPGGASEDEFVDQLVERGAQGIVFVSGLHSDVGASAERYARLLGKGIPIVMINGHKPETGAPALSTDDRLAARLAVSHLADLGHRQIGLAVGQRRYLPALRKVEGFRTAMADLLGLTSVEELIEHTLFSVEGGQAAAAALLDRGCTAVVCGSDLMALGAIRAARSRGLRVPADVSVTGYDDSPLVAFTDPPLTTVRQPVTAMAMAAVDTLLEAMHGGASRGIELVFRPELIVRGSTGAAPR
ncbi:DNA-binding transcriptional regulator, LacI/PurR family [Thermomonospora echinospora]|uniref:DNA-binding transcriptional regulator, LacI/PurR family n=1 Tax=Thermomonospora echinospora TaxID=1992 RepID=A0A1H5XG32_9ACTN|nr:DNA-binding transcriptional regulator, LacI/PurR family [Thermomonospora echinospora]